MAHDQAHSQADHAGVGVPKIIRKTSDQVVVNNSTSMTDVTGLSFAVGANEVWFVECYLIVVGTTAGDIKTTFSGPAGVTVQLEIGSEWGVPSTSGQSALTTQGQPGLPAGSLDAAVLVAGFITTVGTAGTAQLRAAQLVADPSDLVVKTNSFIRATRIA